MCKYILLYSISFAPRSSIIESISYRGFRNFISKRNLESSGYLKDDSLTFCCMVGVVQSCIRTKKFTIVPPPPEMEKDFKHLLDSEIGSDIVFRVKDITFKAHKVILAAYDTRKRCRDAVSRIGNVQESGNAWETGYVMKDVF